MEKIDEKDFTHTESDFQKFKNLTSVQQAAVIKDAWNYPATKISYSDEITALTGSVCGHKKERIKRSMDKLGY